MREITVCVLCDVCWNKEGDRTEAIWSIDYDVRHTEQDVSKRTNSTIDLCEEHHKEVMKGYFSLGRAIANNKPVKLKERSENPSSTGVKPVVPCPVCGNLYTKGPGLTMHVKRVHPEVDREELRRYTNKVVQDRAISVEGIDND